MFGHKKIVVPFKQHVIYRQMEGGARKAKDDMEEIDRE